MYVAYWVFSIIDSSTISAAKRLAAACIDGIQAKTTSNLQQNQRKRLNEKVENGDR